MFTLRLWLSLGNVDVDKMMTGHAWDRGQQRRISLGDILAGLKNPKARITAGEPIGDRLDCNGKPYLYPTRVVESWDRNGDPICIVMALGDGYARVVTVYDG